MKSARDQLLDTTRVLLESQGYRATGLSQILAESGTPKGSLYHYFPQGKEQLAAEAVAGAARILCLRISHELDGPGDIGPLVRRFVHAIADRVEASGFRVGGPLTGVALETVNASEHLNAACRLAYDQVRRTFQDRCLAAGFEEGEAARFSLMITAAIEGATILSRTAHAGEPLRAVGDMLGGMLGTAQRGLLRPSHAG